MKKKKYNIGVDVTYGTYVVVDAPSLIEAKIRAKKLVESDISTPRGTHFIGITTHSEGEA